MKCVTNNRPYSRNRIKFIKDSSSFKEKNDPYIEHKNDWVEIYLFDERINIIKEIIEKVEKFEKPTIFFHGNTGIGKTHILIDLVARLRFKYLKKNMDEKPNSIVFYFMFHFSEFTKKIFLEEFYFSCFPLIRYEKALLKSSHSNQDSIFSNQLTKLENYFEFLFKDYKNEEESLKIYKEIIDHIVIYHDIKLIGIFDQINEISKRYDTNLKQSNEPNPERIEKFYNAFQREDIMRIICASNNNETIRDVLIKNIENEVKGKKYFQFFKFSSIEIRKSQYNRDLIKSILKCKNYPPETCEDDFLKITNGIPIFVDMIPKFFPKFKKNFNLNQYEEGEEKEKIKEDKIADVRFNIDIEKIKKNLKKEIEKFIVTKILKFKLEYFNHFNEDQKNQFKDLLLNLNNITEKMNMDYYFQVIDYQLMDYEYVDRDETEILIKSEYPNIYYLYKNHLELEVDKKVDKITNINSFIHNLANNYNEFAGPYFENAVVTHFILHKGDYIIQNSNNSSSYLKNNKFNVYEKFSYNGILRFDSITLEELSIDYLPSIEKLNENHLIMNKDISVVDFCNMISKNSLFYNKSYNSPLVDGGFIYKSDPLKPHFKIITFDVTVGDKKFSQYLDSLKIEELNNISQNLYSNEKSHIIDKETEGLKKLIFKLQQTIPRTILNFIKTDSFIIDFVTELKVEFDKHIYIFPELMGN